MTRWSAFCQPPNSYTTSWDSTEYSQLADSIAALSASPESEQGYALEITDRVLNLHQMRGSGTKALGLEESVTRLELLSTDLMAGEREN